MGMDVYGKNPKNESGEYFRNSIWSWHPLADYILKVAPADITNQCESWHSNDGDGLDEDASEMLAKFLRNEIRNGNAAKYIEQRERILAALPFGPCHLCSGTGTRRDDVGIRNGMPERVVTEDNLRKGQIGWCNGCAGAGLVQSSEASMRLTFENLVNFVDFLENCGGFEIC